MGQVIPQQPFIAQVLYICATVLNTVSPHMLLAGFTAASRIDSKKHDILDVVAGAAIGLGINLLFTTEYQQQHMKLSYSNFEGNHQEGFTYKF
ncbi:hypothetical protein [Leeuwenhoekiella sp. NPDC079379]|uniref:hypothetical protein n=1 Tax=Leeuwenhoekiella sp. NPDC079379 TaxID=3364122 RepID=UPI0037C97F2E